MEDQIADPADELDTVTRTAVDGLRPVGSAGSDIADRLGAGGRLD